MTTCAVASSAMILSEQADSRRYRPSCRETPARRRHVYSPSNPRLAPLVQSQARTSPPAPAHMPPHCVAMLLRRALRSLPVAALLSTLSTPLAAQSVDAIRGRIVGQDSLPLAGVRVTATSVSGNVSRTTTTDRTGRFTVTFPGGEGDYWITLNTFGFTPKRFEVKRIADQAILIADATMLRGVRLDPVIVNGRRDRPQRNEVLPDIGGTEHTVDQSVLPPDQQGDIAAMASSIPGVTLFPGIDGDPSGFSVLGLTPDQNATTLNGMTTELSDLPRDAGIRTSLVTSPYDVSRGGFSGAQFNIRPQPGSNFITRLTTLNLDAPPMQWTDARASALGQQYSNVSLGGRFSGPISFDKAFYNLAYQLGRRVNDWRTVLNSDPTALQTIGIAADSVTRLLDILGRTATPTFLGGIRPERLGESGSLLAAFDFAPPSSSTGQALNLTVSGNWSRQSPVRSLSTELPAHSGDRTNWGAVLQASHSSYFGIGILSETELGYTARHAYGMPYLGLPSASVRVRSQFSDGSSVVSNLSFGGNSFLGNTTTRGSLSASNQLSWFSANNTHRIKLTSELRRDSYAQDATTNLLGTYVYNSLVDLAAGTPALFTRQLTPRTRRGSDIVGALSLGDSYRPTSNLQVQYGLRLDGNRFGAAPALNPAVERTFGVRNDRVPSRVYLSPRVGFSWTYGTAAQIAGRAGAVRGPRAVVRGGIGIFQNTPQASSIGVAIDNTGLPGAVHQLLCVGAAAPGANWSEFIADPGTIPSHCADGTLGVFADTAPAVTLFDRSYALPRSLRSNLQWSGAVLHNRFSATVEGLYSRNMDQPSTFDVNFNPAARFTVADEGNRPVFVPPGSIVPATGVLASTVARISPLFSHVNQLRSDMHSESRQFSIRLRPLGFSTNWSWSFAYVYSNVREQTRGFSSTSGNPLDVEWSHSSLDARHQITYTFAYNLFDWVRLSWFGQFRSGTPFTPTVGGDINGDGLANDRAFVFDPARTSDPGLANAMQSLVNDGSPAARDCLRTQLGRVADRNSCTGPWTSNAALSFSLNPVKLHLPQRATLSFAVSNPLGAADLLLHGESHLHGWGQQAFPDPALLYVRGFDPVKQQFVYDVNQRFGATSPAVTVFQTPVALTAMLRVDVGPSRERQLLTQQLDHGRTRPGQRAPEMLLKLQYASFGIPNAMAAILRQSDTLHLTGRQADSIATLNRWYVIRTDSIWAPVAKYLATLPDRYDQGEAYTRYRRAREATVDLLIRLVPHVNGVLTAAQRRQVPDLLRAYLDTRYLAYIRSGTSGVNGVFPDMIPPGGFGGIDQAVIMR